MRDEEACRQWLRYYVATGEFAKAEELGWDGVEPPPPSAAEVAKVRAMKDEQAVDTWVANVVGRVFEQAHAAAGEGAAPGDDETEAAVAIAKLVKGIFVQVTARAKQIDSEAFQGD